MGKGLWLSGQDASLGERFQNLLMQACQKTGYRCVVQEGSGDRFFFFCLTTVRFCI